MDGDEFYTSHRLDRYPKDGKMSECKKCLTRHVDNWDPSTYVWILEEIDVPYLPDEWNKLLEKYGQNREKLTGMTILGRYLSKMKLKQYKEFHYDDTERLKAESDEKKTEVMKQSGYSGEEIAAALAAGTTPERPPDLTPPPPQDNTPDPIDQLEPAFFNDDLTEDDKKYLTIKWGKTYKPYEWVQLEQYYQDMMNAFDIQTPAHVDYLKLICKTSLKAHQLIDMGDIEGFQKMSKVYDTLMKSAKFTAAQNKAESGEFVDAVGELVLIAEKEGFIPRYYSDGPKDKVDETLNDLRGYTNTLITEEMNLGNLIESALKTIQIQQDKEEDAETDDEEDLTVEEIEALKDKDFEEHYDFIAEEQESDEQIVEEFIKEEGKE